MQSLYFNFSKVLGRIRPLLSCFKSKVVISWPRMFNTPFRPEIMQGARGWLNPNLMGSSRFTSNFSLGDLPRHELPLRVRAGDLRGKDAGTLVEVSGRVQKVLVGRFVMLKDEVGPTQLVVKDDRQDLQRKIAKLEPDSYMRAVGEVRLRPPNARNDNMRTGDIEVVVHEFIQIQHKRQYDDEDDFDDRKKRKRIAAGKKMTTDEISKCSTDAMRSYFMARTATCSDLNDLSSADSIMLCGWVVAKRVDMFIILKDGYGEVQLVPSKKIGQSEFKKANVDDIIFVSGNLVCRPFGTRNPRKANGNWEIAVTELTVVNAASPECSVKPPDTAEPYTPEEVAGVKDDEIRQTSTQKTKSSTGYSVNKYTGRTHTCGELRGDHIGQAVTLIGWVEFVRLTKFLLLRDGYGATQILVSSSDTENQKKLESVSLEAVVKVTGTVCGRPPNQINLNDHKTGAIEVLAASIEVVSAVQKPLPFSVRDFKKAGASLRLQHRYLDLRFKELQRNLRMRSSVLMRMRQFLIDEVGFVEVETPTLFKRTPGGAREFVVPTHQAGLFYSLVQSPQQLKQLLMVGSMDRYFQVARCYRDETTRPDRQPEFTQLDIELSFCDQNNVMDLIEDLLTTTWDGKRPLHGPFARITYDDAIETYGSDKPDLRISWKLMNLTDEMVVGSADSKVDLSSKIKMPNFAAYGFSVPKGAVVLTGSLKNTMEGAMRQAAPDTSCFVLSCKASDEDNLTALFGTAVYDVIKFGGLGAKEDSVLVIALGPKKQVMQCLGEARVAWADHMEEKGHSVRAPGPHMLWVTDFPLFHEADDGTIQSSHHPFTAPRPQDIPILFTDPLKVIGLHYDLVLNGNEIGGGSIRIHDGELQEKVLDEILKIPTASLEHLLNALKSGAPPHGGIALGLDRLLAVMAGAASIKDVIAFPKSTDGKDLMTGAPSGLTDDEYAYYHLQKPSNGELSNKQLVETQMETE